MYTCKMYLVGDSEIFESDPWGFQGVAAKQKELPFLESLLSFLELDCAGVVALLQQTAELFERYFSSGDMAYADEAMCLLGDLTARHIYFRLPYLQWFERKAQGTMEPDMTKELLQLSEQLPVYQRQAQAFVERILDIDQCGREVQLNARRQYTFDQPNDPALFRFQPIPVSFGPVDGDSSGMILHPNTVRDMIDYSLRECVMRGIPVRRCRSCGRFFPLIGRVTAEYCCRPTVDRKPCRNSAAALKWEQNRQSDQIFRDYRREYKRRFAWIKAGKYTEDEFSEWSRRAREKRTECEKGKITMEEFKGWLRKT